MQYTIVFVCTGNTCRSPMAQVILRDLLADAAGTFNVLSAGTHASTGAPAAGPAVDVLAQSRLRLDDHRSRPLSQELVTEADLLLTMTDAQKVYVIDAYPEAAAKTFTLKKFVGLPGDVHDPFGGDMNMYRETEAELRALLQTAARRLLEEQGH